VDAAGRVVVIVEDDMVVGALLSEAINEEPGYRALHIPTPTRALAALEQLVPDLLVVDMRLPEMSGLDLYDAVRGDTRMRKVPVIFETGEGAAHADELRRRGIASYVSKPFDPFEVVGYVKHLAPARPFSARATN
jgi:CheY-like chemotaxis protein